jgi:hypothetical protein
MDLMVRTLRKFETSTGYPKEIAPELCVDFHESGEQFWGWLLIGFKGINLAGTIVDESHH